MTLMSSLIVLTNMNCKYSIKRRRDIELLKENIWNLDLEAEKYEYIY